MKEQAQNCFIFTFSRMNPPTPGHLLLIESMIMKAIELGQEKIFVLLSKTKGDKSNPLTCNQNDGDNELLYKKNILDEMIINKKLLLAQAETDPIKVNKILDLNVIVLCATGNPLGFMSSTLEEYFPDKNSGNVKDKVKVYFFVGEDRSSFNKTIEKMFNPLNRDDIEAVYPIELTRKGMEELKNMNIEEIDINNVNDNNISGSFIRNVIANDRQDIYNHIYSKYLAPETISLLYETVKGPKEQTEVITEVKVKPAAKKRELTAETRTITTDNKSKKRSKTVRLGGKRKKYSSKRHNKVKKTIKNKNYKK